MNCFVCGCSHSDGQVDSSSAPAAAAGGVQWNEFDVVVVEERDADQQRTSASHDVFRDTRM